MWTRKQKRCFQRLLSGLHRAHNLGSKLRFLTLTTAPGSGGGINDSRDLHRWWGTFVKRARKKYGLFEFCKVSTREGNGVLHVLYRGSFIPQRWISKNWREITHGSSVVWISAVWSDPRDVSRYMVQQYVAGQSFLHIGYSANWIFKGAAMLWHSICKKFHYCMKDSLAAWSAILKKSRIDLLTELRLAGDQVFLDRYITRASCGSGRVKR